MTSPTQTRQPPAHGSDLDYSTYRGGSGFEYPGGVEANSTGWAYLAYQSDGRVLFEQVNADGSDLLVNASLDGSDLDTANAIAIQGCCAFVTGYTRSSDFPTTPGAFQTSFGGASDAFVAKIEAFMELDYTIYTQEQGFDKCVHPNASEMQTWRTLSPYRYIGIYIGGDSRACAQPDLNLSWISAAGAQGWGFIPIWVGPQAPRWANPSDPEGERRVCADRDFAFQINLDPAIARNQGIEEAGDAVEAAYQLGLVDETRMGTIIYYDLERYQPGEPECNSAVNAFIEGWVSELQNLGNKAGIYGHVINVDQWYSLDPAPDAIWYAYYPVQQCPDVARGRYCYDPNIDVYGVPYLSDDRWQQSRLRQYNNSHKEPYGNIEFTIDSDAADGIVAVPAGSDPSSFELASVSFPRYAAVNGLEFTVQKMDLITADVGWAIINNRLRWTEDGGAAWEDITPMPGTVLEDAFFLNTSAGWAISAEIDEWGLVDDQYLSSTTDAGQSWQTTQVDDIDMAAGYSAIYLDFVDAQSGWVVLRLPSSGNFSFGQLYRTNDGGASWSRLDIPLGEPVNFIDTQVGWVAGGVAGDQLYVTRDGGASWGQQEVVSKAPGGTYLMYHLPTFENSLEGVLPVVVNDLPDTRVEFYGTSDGGVTWNPSDVSDLDREIRPGTTFPIAVTESGEWRLPTPPSLPGIPPGVTALDFVSKDIGWAYTTTNVCTTQESGIQGEQETVCTAQSELLRTEDGGETWSESMLPVSTIYLPLISR
ncbi:MAG: glycoside hydrolase domain-containing protein [Anaerolineales bacterium]